MIKIIVRIPVFCGCVFSLFLSVLRVLLLYRYILLGIYLGSLISQLSAQSRYHLCIIIYYFPCPCFMFSFVSLSIHVCTHNYLFSNRLINSPIVLVKVNCFLLAIVQLSITLPRVSLTS